MQRRANLPQQLCSHADDRRQQQDTPRPAGDSFLHSEDVDDEEVGAALEAEPERYLLIEPRESREGFRDMEDFARTVRDPGLVGKLEVALSGRGAFRRFKDVLRNYPTERQRWFEFQARRLEVFARKWLEANDIELVPRPSDRRPVD